ncbi:MAG: hypothetical protein LBT83_03790 [Tannerella sp.]|jgi:hypothetical protein|nr:hypothetical protein [Tannerella sp.]
MKKFKFTQFVIGLICVVCCLSCEKDEPESIAEGSLIALELTPEAGFDYYVTDGDVDICFKINPETSKPTFASVRSIAQDETFHIIFDESGYPLIYEFHGVYAVIGNFSGTLADISIIENDEIIVHRQVETGVEWDGGFYEAWNSASTRAVDWGKLGGLFLDELKPVLIGIGYGVKAIPAMGGMLMGDKSAYVDFAKNFVEMIDEAIPDNRYIQITKDLLNISSDAYTYYNVLQGKFCTSTIAAYDCVLMFVQEGFDQLGEVIADLGRPEKIEQIELGQYVLMGGYGTIQVTLRWDNQNDIDLWVEDPNRETIFWNHMTSVSGGFLDYDNTVAYGPENIFWADTKLAGPYYVYVNHYAGNTAANYTVYIYAFEKSKIVKGRIGVGETKLIAVFDTNSISTHVTSILMNETLDKRTLRKK